MNYVRPSAAFVESLRAHLHEARRGVDLRRGDDGLSRGGRGRAGAFRDPSRPHRRWGKSSAAGCPWAPSAGAATSWRSSRPSVPSTRPERFQATRLR
jgi:hypothetical protein